MSVDWYLHTKRTGCGKNNKKQQRRVEWKTNGAAPQNAELGEEGERRE